MRDLRIGDNITVRFPTLERYLQDISREKLLTAEEEVDLAQRIKKGDRKALEKMVKANLRFVVSVAKQYQNQGLGLLDLINEGNLGLIKAAEKFDETRGFKFISYAVWWIRQSIMEAIAAQGPIVHTPINQAGMANRIRRFQKVFEQTHERQPSVDEIATHLNIPEERIIDAMKADTRKIALDAPISDEEGESLIEKLPTKDEPPTDNTLVEQSLKDEIRVVLGFLDERERNIVAAFYGLDQPERTMEEIGNKYGLTRERVRQIREKAIRKLRKNTKSKVLKDYLGR